MRTGVLCNITFLDHFTTAAANGDASAIETLVRLGKIYAELAEDMFHELDCLATGTAIGKMPGIDGMIDLAHARGLFMPRVVDRLAACGRPGAIEQMGQIARRDPVWIDLILDRLKKMDDSAAAVQIGCIAAAYPQASMKAIVALKHRDDVPAMRHILIIGGACLRRPEPQYYYHARYAFKILDEFRKTHPEDIRNDRGIVNYFNAFKTQLSALGKPAAESAAHPG